MSTILKDNTDHEHIANALRYCWGRGIYAYPVVYNGKGKHKPDVKIQMKVGDRIINGVDVYSQRNPKALYDKINELYLHHFNNRDE